LRTSLMSNQFTERPDDTTVLSNSMSTSFLVLTMLNGP
jgi:hypothetical protein